MKLCALSNICVWKTSTIEGIPVSTVYCTHPTQFGPPQYQGVPLFQREVPKRLSWISDESSNNRVKNMNRKDVAEEPKLPHHRRRRGTTPWLPDHNVWHAKANELPICYVGNVPFPSRGMVTDFSRGTQADCYDATTPNRTIISTVYNQNNRKYGASFYVAQVVVAICPPYGDSVFTWTSPGVTVTGAGEEMVVTWRSSTGSRPWDAYWNEHYAGTTLPVRHIPYERTPTRSWYEENTDAVQSTGLLVADDIANYIEAREFQPVAATFYEAKARGAELDLQFSFELGETGDYAGYSFTIPEAVNTRLTLQQHAYKDAVDHIAHTWGNGLQNVAALVASIVFLRKHAFQSAEIPFFTVGSDISTSRTAYPKWAKQVVTRKFRYSWKKTWLSLDNIMTGMPREWRGMWLQYRYILMTSILDSRELFEKRLTSDDMYSLKRIQQGHWERAYGISHATVRDVDITCRCRLRFRYKPLLQGFSQLGLTLEDLSLVPDLYVIWDFIPYSFVVDWFVPYGDIFEAVDTNHKLEENFEIRDVLFSLKYTHEWNGLQVTNYSRYRSLPLDLNGLYWMSNSVSGKTVGKRLVDAAALFL